MYKFTDFLDPGADPGDNLLIPKIDQTRRIELTARDGQNMRSFAVKGLKEREYFDKEWTAEGAIKVRGVAYITDSRLVYTFSSFHEPGERLSERLLTKLGTREWVLGGHCLHGWPYVLQWQQRAFRTIGGLVLRVLSDRPSTQEMTIELENHEDAESIAHNLIRAIAKCRLDGELPLEHRRELEIQLANPGQGASRSRYMASLKLPGASKAKNGPAETF